MNCSFIAYPAEPEHKNVLEVFREPIGRKNGEGSADLWGTKKHTKHILLNKMGDGWLFKRLSSCDEKGLGLGK